MASAVSARTGSQVVTRAATEKHPAAIAMTRPVPATASCASAKPMGTAAANASSSAANWASRNSATSRWPLVGSARQAQSASQTTVPPKARKTTANERTASVTGVSVAAVAAEGSPV